MSPSLHIRRTAGGLFCISLSHPEFALEVEGIQQLDNVMVVAGGQYINLYHVILQFILRLCVDNLGSSERPVLFVLCLRARFMTKERKWLCSSNNSEYRAMHTLTPVWIKLSTVPVSIYAIRQRRWKENGTKRKTSFYNRNPTGTNMSRICQVHFLLFLFSPPPPLSFPLKQQLKGQQHKWSDPPN